MSRSSLEKRVAELERQLAELLSRGEKPSATSWRETVGMFSHDPLMKEIDAAGQAWREADAKARRRCTGDEGQAMIVLDSDHLSVLNTRSRRCVGARAAYGNLADQDFATTIVCVEEQMRVVALIHRRGAGAGSLLPGTGGPAAFLPEVAGTFVRPAGRGAVRRTAATANPHRRPGPQDRGDRRRARRPAALAQHRRFRTRPWFASGILARLSPRASRAAFGFRVPVSFHTRQPHPPSRPHRALELLRESGCQSAARRSPPVGPVPALTGRGPRLGQSARLPAPARSEVRNRRNQATVPRGGRRAIAVATHPAQDAVGLELGFHRLKATDEHGFVRRLGQQFLSTGAASAVLYRRLVQSFRQIASHGFAIRNHRHLREKKADAESVPPRLRESLLAYGPPRTALTLGLRQALRHTHIPAANRRILEKAVTNNIGFSTTEVPTV